MKLIAFEHYKTGERVEILYKEFIDNPQSDRIVVLDEEKKQYMDIMKSTIIEIKEVLNG